MVDLSIHLPENYLKQEERMGYTVSTSMKEVWAVELDLLRKLLDVCQKYDLKIFAIGGTLLGTIRHKGYIPWDDDIDMAMERSDYERLCEVAASEFEAPYFFQTEYTEEGTLRGHAQLRNSNTTAILKNEYGKVFFNQGIFIDIFPLDAVVENADMFQKQGKRAKRYRRIAFKIASFSSRYSAKLNKGVKGFVKGIIHTLGRPFIRGLKLEQKYYKRFEDECKRYNHMETEEVSLLSFQFESDRFRVNKDDYKEIITMPFEFYEMPVPIGYDKILTRAYGEYMKMVKEPTIHGGAIFDAGKSYDKYLQEI